MSKSFQQFERLAVAAFLGALLVSQLAKADGPNSPRFGNFKGSQFQQQIQQKLNRQSNGNPAPQLNNLTQRSKKQAGAQQPKQQATNNNGQQGQAGTASPRLRKLFKTPSGAVPFQNGNTGINGGGQPQANPVPDGGGASRGTPQAFARGKRGKQAPGNGNVAASQNQAGQTPVRNFSLPNPIDVASDAIDAAGDVAAGAAQGVGGAISDVGQATGIGAVDGVGELISHPARSADTFGRVFGPAHYLPHPGADAPAPAPLPVKALGKKKRESPVDYGGVMPAGDRGAIAFPVAGIKLPGVATPANPSPQGAPAPAPAGQGNGTPMPNGQAGNAPRGGFPWQVFLPGNGVIPGRGQGYPQQAPVIVEQPGPTAEVPVQYTEAEAPVQHATARPVAVKSARADLVLEDIEYLEAPTLLVGPAYRIKFRNQGLAESGKFHVGLAAGLGVQMDENSPHAWVEVEGLAGGQIGEATIRLPRTVLKLAGAGGQPTVFTHLLIAVDADDAVNESDETNNDVTIERAELEAATQ